MLEPVPNKGQTQIVAQWPNELFSFSSAAREINVSLHDSSRSEPLPTHPRTSQPHAIDAIRQKKTQTSEPLETGICHVTPRHVQPTQ
jgi:hypothetical protein